MSDKESKTKASGCTSVITDIAILFSLLFILEICGCNVFESIGHAFGKVANGFHDATHQIHPSDCR